MRNCKISEKSTIKEGVIIGDNVTIEDDVFIDYQTIIRDNVHLNRGTKVGARCILGEYLQDFYTDCKNKNHPLIIGEDSLIRSETIIYGECQIGNNFQTGHKVTIREHSKIGEHVQIGTLSDIQGKCTIGNYVKLHSNVHVGQGSNINDYVWIYPYVVLTNDPTPPSNNIKGVTVENFAVIAVNAVILPGVHISTDVLVGAGSVVTKDVKEGTFVIGNPARVKGKVTEIIDKDTGELVYPWRYYFDRCMPWNGIGYDAWIAVKRK